MSAELIERLRMMNNAAAPSPASKEPKGLCSCVYATSKNTESVRKGYEMGGYVLELCQSCKDNEI